MRTLDPRRAPLTTSSAEEAPDEPSKARKPPSARRLVGLVALAVLVAGLLLFIGRDHSRGTVIIAPPTTVEAIATPATATTAAADLPATTNAIVPEVPAATTPRGPWLPTPAPAGAISAATDALTKLGLRTLGAKPGDAFLLGVRPSTGTVEAVSPLSIPSFSYTLPLRDPSVSLHWGGSGRTPRPMDRSEEGFHHLGDVTMRLRPAGSTGGFTQHSTVSKTPPLAVATGGDGALKLAADGRSASVDASACLTPTVPNLSMQRSVKVDGPEVRISLTLTNKDPISSWEIGALGLSMPMNQLFTGRTLPSVAERCSFTEVYVGGEGGYVQVTRTTGDGPVLLVLPLDDYPSPPGSQQASARGWRGFEGWRPLKWEDRANYDWMHEMLYEIVIHSRAYASNEWRGATPWAPPTSHTLPPGASVTYGVRLRLARDVEGVNEALLAAQMPVAVPLPAATLHMDMTDAQLHLLTPASLLLVGKRAEPSGCLDIGQIPISRPAGHGHDPATSLQSLPLRPLTAGRCRLALSFKRAEGGGELTQYVHYHVLEPAAKLLERHGEFASTVGWLAGNASDPWHRGPGYMGTDAEVGNGVGAPLLEEPRVFMAGMSDESGASAPLAMSVKQLGLPSTREVAQLEDWVHNTLWAGSTGVRKNFLQGSDHSVRLSMLYWSDAIDADPAGPAQSLAPALYKHCHKCWAGCSKKRDCCYWMHCWSEEHSLETWRAYNYPHVATDYWALYRLGRHFNPPLTKRADWRWYLEQAGKTAVAMSRFGGRGTNLWGLMVGSTFATILSDLRREGMTALANELEAAKDKRMKKWLSMIFPYGSEFPWDSTGHEEIHTWLLRDGRHTDANKTVQAVLAYSTVVPHWAYCGSARRYWDFTINGKTQWGNEREFHHYGSTLNAIAVLDSYRAYPTRHYLLQLGACALLGHLSNIHPSGAASMAWHGDPGLLRRDGYSGDYGPGVYGYWRSAAAYVTCMPPYGWSCFLCDLHQPAGLNAPRADGQCDPNEELVITPRDAFGRRAYLAPLGLTVAVEGAAIRQLTLVAATRTLTVDLATHARAPSTEATIFLTVEGIEPPPPRLVSAYQLRCDGGGECARPSLLPGEYVIRLATTGTTRVTIAAP